MKLQFLAISNPDILPDHYSVDAEQELIEVHKNQNSEAVDLSALQEGGEYAGVEFEHIDMLYQDTIPCAERKDGELFVTLWQATPITDSEITFENFDRRCRISYDQFQELGIEKGQPADLKEEINLLASLKSKHLRKVENKEDDAEVSAALAAAQQEFEDFELIPSEIQFLRRGHWRKSDWIDASDYDPTKTYIKRIDTDGNTEA